MGFFKHAETGVFFTYDDAGEDTVFAPPPHGGRNVTYLHRVYIGNEVHGQGWRSALVKGSVAYVIVDERENDGIMWNVVERWPIVSHMRG